MARQHERDFDRVFNFARTSLFIQPLSDPVNAALDDEGLAVDPEEPPDHRFTASPHSYSPSVTETPISKTAPAQVWTKKSATPMTRQSSLLTEGLLTAANLKDLPLSPTNYMSRAGSQASAYSLTSNHGLTSDGGLSSAGHSGTPSPPFPPMMQAPITPAPTKVRAIKFAGDKAVNSSPAPAIEPAKPEVQDRPRKTCISFACAPPRPSEPQQPQRACTIKFACPAKPTTTQNLPARPSLSPAPTKDIDLQATPKPLPILLSRPQGSQSTVLDSEKGTARKVPSGDAVSPTEIRKLEKKKKAKQISGIRPEDEDWMTEEPKLRKPITVSDTLRKENAIRKLAEEASQELDEEYDIDDIVDDEDEDEDLPATGSRYMAFDDDESDGGHETDDEEGFAASDDDESDDDPDFQFWTPAQVPVPASIEHSDLLKPRVQHHRTASESSLDSHLKHDSGANGPKAFLQSHGTRRRRSPKEVKMRPGTPELPDSTDFVCGTLDEDRPLEEAYLSCIKQRKLERRGIIPQDLDPSFPTSDPENIDEDEEDEVTEDHSSTASDHHFLGGRFDESDASEDRGRNSSQRPPQPHRPSPRRLRSPPPKPRFKSPVPISIKSRAKPPAPTSTRSRAKSPAPPALKSRAKSPAPRKLFGHSPLRPKSPAPLQYVASPPTSPKGLMFAAPQLAQRHVPVRTASLPHTPNPFFVAQERRMRARAKKESMDSESHSRGPIDIKQGLEARKQRRKEQYWRKHCRDHKDKSRRCAKGKGAERMRELGIEMAHRNRAYGQKLQLMLSA